MKTNLTIRSIMKRIFAFSAILAVVLTLFCGCQEDSRPVSENAATIVFKAVGMKTSIGSISGGKVTYSWQNTAAASVHIFENSNQGTSPSVTVDANTGQATFTATFASQSAPYAYKACIAANLQNGCPAVPATQTPSAASFDPAADVLVGRTTEAFQERPANVEMYFERAVVIGKFVLKNLPSGEAVQSVRIVAPEGTKLAGSATGIDYAEGTCTYGAATGDTHIITLNYTTNNVVSGDFNAFFVCCPLADPLATYAVQVTTDKHTITRAVTAKTPINLSLGRFPQVSLDMSKGTCTYTRVSSVTSGRKYVIVDGTTALRNNAGTPAAYSVDGMADGDDLVVPAADAAALEWTVEYNDVHLNNGSYTARNGSYYAARADNSTVEITNGIPSERSSRYVWTYSSDRLWHNSSVEPVQQFYVNYNAGWKASTDGGSHTVILYEESTGSAVAPDPVTPVDPPSPSATTYTKVATATTSLEDGIYLIVNPASDNALDGTSTTSTNSIAVAPVSGVISGEQAALEFEIKAVTGGYTIKHLADNKYLYSYDNNPTYLGYQNSENLFTIETKGTDLFCFKTTRSSQDVYLYFNENNFYRFGASGGAPASQYAGVQLFKRNGGSTPVTPDGPVSADVVVNLENAYLSDYLNAAASAYTDSNHTGTSIIENYVSTTSRRDIPTPATLTWTATAGSGDYTVSIYNDASRTVLETQQTTGSTSLDIYNLIPDSTYWYTVTRNAAEVKSGTIRTQGRRRMMLVSTTFGAGHANNCRDLGGIRNTAGQTIKYGLVFRGTNMDVTTSAEKAYLTGHMKVAMDIDLRSSSDTRNMGADNGYACSSRVLGNDVGYTNPGYNSWSDLQDLTKLGTTFNAIINTVTAGETCYIHCFVGADRTGFICMLLEAALGVSPKECSIDFEMTSFLTRALTDVDGNLRKRSETGGEYNYGKYYNFINGYGSGSFQDKAQHILRDAGITQQQIEALCGAMLE